MDKPVSIWALLSAFGIFIVLGTSVPNALLAMLITGVIPGTNYTLPLWVVVIIYPAIAFTALLWIASQPIFIGESERPVKDPVVAKASAPKKKQAALKQPALKRRPRSAI